MTRSVSHSHAYTWGLTLSLWVSKTCAFSITWPVFWGPFSFSLLSIYSFIVFPLEFIFILLFIFIFRFSLVICFTYTSNFTFTFHFHALEKEMATHSSVLAWRIPGTGEPGGLLSVGSHRVGHDWSDLAAAAAAAAAYSQIYFASWKKVNLYSLHLNWFLGKKRNIQNL